MAIVFDITSCNNHNVCSCTSVLLCCMIHSDSTAHHHHINSCNITEHTCPMSGHQFEHLSIEGLVSLQSKAACIATHQLVLEAKELERKELAAKVAGMELLRDEMITLDDKQTLQLKRLEKKVGTVRSTCSLLVKVV